MIYLEIIHVHPGQTIPLGRYGENLARQIVFDISEWRKLYGPGSVELIHQRQNDSNPYPVTLEPSDENEILWTVRSFDTDQICHYGKAELRYLIGPLSTEQTVVKSAVYQTEVLPALGPPVADAPDAQLDWLAELKETIETASQNAQTVVDLAADVNVVRTQIAADRQAASQSAADAHTSETNASQSAQNAAQFAANSQTSAHQAAQYAANAQTSETNAAQSAQSAATQASAAQSAETAARNWAIAAQSAADTSESTSRIYAPFAVLTASGNPVEIDDSADNLPVKSLTVEIPVTQSGSGDPCLAGHGKNLIRSMPDSRVTADITYTVADDGSITANGTSTGNAIIDIPVSYLAAGNYILNGCPEGGSNASTNSYTIIMQNNNGDIYGRNNGNDVSVTLPEDHKAFLRVLCRNGYTANNLVFRPMIRHADVTDGTWAPYVNIRPFVGTDSVTVTRTGKNLVPILRTNDATHGGTTAHMLGDGRYTINGKHSSSAGVMGLNPIVNLADEQDRLAEPLFVMKKGVTYYVSGCQITYRAGNPQAANISSLNAISYPSASNPVKVTPGVDWYVKQIRIFFSANMEYNSGTIYEPMITSDSGKVWEPYQGQSVTVSTGDAGTVYGGNLNVTTGVLTVTHGHIAAYAGEIVPDGWVSSTGELSDGAEIVYPLETPVTYQLTPQELKTLLGVNYITSDTGTISTDYRADPTILYQKLQNALISMGENL